MNFKRSDDYNLLGDSASQTPRPCWGASPHTPRHQLGTSLSKIENIENNSQRGNELMLRGLGASGAERPCLHRSSDLYLLFFLRFGALSKRAAQWSHIFIGVGRCTYGPKHVRFLYNGSNFASPDRTSLWYPPVSWCFAPQ